MRLMLAVSRASERAAGDVAERVRRAFVALHGRPPATHLRAPDGGGFDEVFGTEPAPGDIVDHGDMFAWVLQRGAFTTSGTVVDGRRILDGARRDETAFLRSVCAPFAASYRSSSGGPLTITTDACGLRHVYRWQGNDWAAVSSSSLLLALVVGAPVNEGALATFAVVGNHLLDSTPFVGIEKIPAGSRCRLERGRLTLLPFGTPAGANTECDDRRWHPGDGAAAVRAAVASCLDAYPDAGLELSGGLDSRTVLAAIPTEARRGRFALTLGTPGDADVRIATDLASRCGLDHQFVDLSPLADIEPQQALALARRAALRRDCTANPINTAMLDWVEERVGPRPRLNGQNAEFGRGVLYNWQRQRASVGDRHLAKTASGTSFGAHNYRWWAKANSTIDQVVVHPSFLQQGWRATEAAHRSLIDGFRTDWLRSLDEYYLQSRVQRWAGIDYSVSGYGRVILAPFCHPAFLAWVRSCDPTDRRHSRAFARAFETMDPDLAGVPLHTGVTPHEVAVSGPAIWAKRQAGTARRVSGNLVGRVRGTTGGVSGPACIGAAVMAAWREDDRFLERLARFSFLDTEAVARVVAGDESVSGPTVAFLVELDTIAMATDAFSAGTADVALPAER